MQLIGTASLVLIDSGATHIFMSTVFAQAVQTATINIEPMCVKLGNKFKAFRLSTRGKESHFPCD